MSDDDKDRENGPNEESLDEAREFLPVLDFSSLALPFFTQGLVALGLMEDPFKGEQRLRLDLAQRLIDLLELLKQRTEGNLEPEEERFLESCITQLKSAYLQKAEFLKT